MLGAAIFCLASMAARADTLYRLQAQFDGQWQGMEVSGRDIDGKPYVSLEALARGIQAQLSGEFPSMVVRRGDREITLSDGEQRAQSGAGALALLQPVSGQGSALWVSLSDLETLCTQGLNVPVRLAAQLPSEEGEVLPLPPLAEGEIPASAPEGVSVDETEAKLLETAAAATAPAVALEGVSEGAADEVLKPAVSTRILIDAGHGGSDSGVVGANNMTEKEITLSVARMLADLLKVAGFQVQMSRSDDREMSPHQRAALARQAGAGTMISLHVGASFSPKAQGMRLFIPVYPPAVKEAADAQNNTDALNRRLAESIASTMGEQKPAIRQVALRQFASPATGGLLVELGYGSNPEEAARLGSAAYQGQLAQSLAQGLRQALLGAEKGVPAP